MPDCGNIEPFLINYPHVGSYFSPHFTMRKILILGAGRSASSLIKYLLDRSSEQELVVTVADRDADSAREAMGGETSVHKAMALDASNAQARRSLIAEHDLVISMLPAFLHLEVVRDCMNERKNVATPSYVPDEMWSMEGDIQQAGITVLNEMGLDPGIDHMSAMRVLDRIRSNGGTMTSFESYTGGLIAPESDDNPWGYKFTWNPRNVVLAGQGAAARFVRDTRLRFIPYHRLFTRYAPIHVEGYGAFEGYANRDSLKYREHYGLEDIPTLVRGTLRREGFCKGWNVFVQLGCTDDSYEVPCEPDMTYGTFFNRFLPPGEGMSMRQTLAKYLQFEENDPVLDKLEWLGVFDGEKIGMTDTTPAKILQQLLEKKWALKPDDKDMIVMWHRFRYEQNGKERALEASLVVEGKDQRYTAMSDTVGLPIGIAAEMILNGEVQRKGVVMPLTSDIYDPVLDRLESMGITFREDEV